MKICRHEKVPCAASIGARCEARRDCCSPNNVTGASTGSENGRLQIITSFELSFDVLI